LVENELKFGSNLLPQSSSLTYKKDIGSRFNETSKYLPQNIKGDIPQEAVNAPTLPLENSYIRYTRITCLWLGMELL